VHVFLRQSQWGTYLRVLLSVKTYHKFDFDFFPHDTYQVCQEEEGGNLIYQSTCLLWMQTNALKCILQTTKFLVGLYGPYKCPSHTCDVK